MAVGFPVETLQDYPVVVEARLGKYYDGVEDNAYCKYLNKSQEKSVFHGHDSPFIAYFQKYNTQVGAHLLQSVYYAFETQEKGEC